MPPSGTPPTRAEPELFRRYPRLRAGIAWLPLGTLPTPIERIPELRPGSEIQEGEAWVKRDDRTGAPYGGNKVRKLEFLLGEALGEDAVRVLTAGAIGSHHALATTVYARALELAVTLVLFPQRPTRHVCDILLMNHGLGAELRFSRRMELVPIDLFRARLAYRGERVASIPPGGSNALGTLGYVDAALELVGQCEAGQAPIPDVVYLPAGTLGTAVGLALGFAIAGATTRVVGFRITGRVVTNERRARRLVKDASALLRGGVSRLPPASDVLARLDIDASQFGAGYGRATPAGEAAADRLAAVGLGTDPTYTAKAAAGFLAAMRSSPGGVHLFWHTLSARHPVDALERGRARLDSVPAPFRRYVAESAAAVTAAEPPEAGADAGTDER